MGLSNEITIAGESEDLLKNHQELNDLVHELDPTRKTVMAHVSMLRTESPLVSLPDATSYNHYFDGIQERSKTTMLGSMISTLSIQIFRSESQNLEQTPIQNTIQKTRSWRLYRRLSSNLSRTYVEDGHRTSLDVGYACMEWIRLRCRREK